MNCQHPLGHRKRKRVPEKNIYFCFIDYAKAFHCVNHNKLWKILKEMGIPDHKTCLLRNLYACQEETVRTGHGTHWFQIGKGVHQGCMLSPCLFNLYAEYIMWNARLDEAQESFILWGGGNLRRLFGKVTLVHVGADKGVISCEDLDWEQMTMALWLYWNRFSLLSFHSFITQAE